MSTTILLTTLTATYQHASLGLRYLLANMEELQSQTTIQEFTINSTSREIAEKILRLSPPIVGFGVYIWNTRQTCEVISIIKKVAPQITVIVGGPEVSYESETQEITKLSDFVVKGEADFLFRDLCRDILANRSREKFISAILPDIQKIKSPYLFYNENDIANRVIYVEASRGCPYKCEYCLSSLDKSVRNFPLENFLADLKSLLQKGVRQFKFIDRTFNLSITTCSKILNFFLENLSDDLFLHFEMVPDRLPDEIRELIKKFPQGSLQFEVGIQTLNDEVAKRISRRNDMKKVKENFAFLTEKTKVHIHADLIVGLPGEDLENFGIGFDQLHSWAPHEIQVGVLKRLKGAPIGRHENEFKMIYSDQPPFQILQTKHITFSEIQSMTRFAKYWDLFANSGNFPNFIQHLEQSSLNESFFKRFFHFSEFLSERHGEGIAVSRLNLFGSALTYLTGHLALEERFAKEILAADFSKDGKIEAPKFLLSARSEIESSVNTRAGKRIMKRQTAHQRQRSSVEVLKSDSQS